MNIITRNTPRLYLRNGDLNLAEGGVAYYSSGISSITGAYLPALPMEEGGYLVETPVTFMQNILMKRDLTVEGNTNIAGNTLIDGDLNINGNFTVNGKEFEAAGYLKDMKDVNYNWYDWSENGYLQFKDGKWLYQTIEEHQLETGIGDIQDSIDSIRDKLDTLTYYHTSSTYGIVDSYKAFAIIYLNYDPTDRPGTYYWASSIRVDIEIADAGGVSIMQLVSLPAHPNYDYAIFTKGVGIGPHSVVYFGPLEDLFENNIIVIPLIYENPLDSLVYYPYVDVRARCFQMDATGKEHQLNWVKRIEIANGFISSYTGSDGEGGFYTNYAFNYPDRTRPVLPPKGDYYHLLKINVTAPLLKAFDNELSIRGCSLQLGKEIVAGDSTTSAVYGTVLKSSGVLNGIGRTNTLMITPQEVSINGSLIATKNTLKNYYTLEQVDDLLDSLTVKHEEDLVNVNNSLEQSINNLNSDLNSKFEEKSLEVDLRVDSWMIPINNRLINVEGLLGDIELLLDKILGYETNEYLNETLDEIIG